MCPNRLHTHVCGLGPTSLLDSTGTSFYNIKKCWNQPSYNNISYRTLASGARRRGDPRLISESLFVFCVKGSRHLVLWSLGTLNWSFRDSKARDWLRKGKVLTHLVRPT